MRTAKLILVVAAIVAPCVASVESQPTHHRALLPLSHSAPARNSRFTPLSTQCTRFQPPRLISGPAKIEGSTARTVLVDIVVLENGRLDAPFIIDGADALLEEQIHDILSGWRYQPATCDGNPIDAEGRIHLKLESTKASPKSELKNLSEH